MTVKVVLRRNNGRFVKEKEARSKYHAKIIRNAWEGKYDDTYYVEIEIVGASDEQ